MQEGQISWHKKSDVYIALSNDIPILHDIVIYYYLCTFVLFWDKNPATTLCRKKLK
ncbi:hypothetical protein SAMN05660862_2963 [Sphingobacterium psychroaquaticum]|uniref:Uncharacterized protein n=1 Tax=Sphingobacterium psychroaquaticum TaxID=561061 RepID=A0A1X7KIG8_9SPHI|nr:hypothetical protein SAMN05660862_2963 [Sphingobacterium psychroaquaticum]